MGPDDICQAIYFVVQGKIDLIVEGSDGKTHVLETLKQGDVLGQYHCLFNQSFMFSVVAKSQVRLLLIDQKFFMNKLETLEGLRDRIRIAEQVVERCGIPVCDFKIYHNRNSQLMSKIKRCVYRASIMNKLEGDSWKWALNQMKKRLSPTGYKDKKRHKKNSPEKNVKRTSDASNSIRSLKRGATIDPFNLIHGNKLRRMSYAP